MSLDNAVDYSIIICTYNPDERLLKRCLAAVYLLNTQGLSVEVILVDNNSTLPIGEMDYVKSFLTQMPNLRLIEVKEQGLSHARIGGIKVSSGSWIIFFDDDNEPGEAYIQELNSLLKNYPQVAAWGPGEINVDFLDGIVPSLNDFAKEAFQDRHETHITYANQRFWQSCYPFGTGLCINRSYLESYISLVEQGGLSLSDRKGNQLSSGGDTQMVLYCISKGAAAGVAPGLKLTHIVPGKRSTLHYLKRLTYGTSVCYSTCLVEVFPEYRDKLKIVKEGKFVFKTLKRYFFLLFNSSPKKILGLVNYIGSVAGDYMVLKRPVPSPILWVLKKLKAV